MRRALIVAAVILGMSAPPGTAAATTVSAPVGSGFPYQRWADEALVPGPPAIEVLEMPTPCDGGAACTGPGYPIQLGPFVTALPLREARQIFYHEEGHHFDYDLMADWARARFEALVGDLRPWQEGPNSPHEKFAEAWATCAEHATLRSVPLNYGYDYRPTPRIHRKVCHMIDVVAGA